MLGAVLVYIGFTTPTTRLEPLTVYRQGLSGRIRVAHFKEEVWRDEKRGHTYFLTELDDGTLLVLRGSQSNREIWQRYQVSGNDTPYYTHGRLTTMAADLREKTALVLNDMDLEISPDAPTTTLFLALGSPAGMRGRLLAIGATAMPVGLFLFLFVFIYRLQARRTKRYIQERYPHYDSFRFLDEYRDFEIPARRLFVKDGLLLVEHLKLSAVDLNDVGWMYYRRTLSKHLWRPYLQVFSKSEKMKGQRLLLAGRPGFASLDLMPFFDYIEEHYPAILIGSSLEQRQRYLATFD